MRRKAPHTFMIAAAVSGALMLLPAVARGQAQPGPIQSPPSSSSDAHATAQPEVAKAPPQRKDITGSWKMNLDASDNPMRKIQDARASRNAGNGGGNSGGGRGNGGVWGGGGGYPGGGGGYPGGRGGGGGGGGNGRPRNSGGDDSDSDHQTLADALNSPETLNFAQKDGEVDLTSNAEGFQRTYYTDGRKIEKSKDDANHERAAHWDDIRLVSEEKGPRGGKITRTFEPAPGGQQLFETVHYEGGRLGPIDVRFVYDNAKQEKPQEPATGTSSSSSN